MDIEYIDKPDNRKPHLSAPGSDSRIMSPTMDIDEPDDRAGALTLQIPPDDLECICERLQRFIRPDDSDDYIRGYLCEPIWTFVNDALKLDPQRSNRLADFDTFLTNVERTGEAEFFQLLRNSAEKKSWVEVLESDVFLNAIEDVSISKQDQHLADESPITAEQAWKTDFNGGAADGLLIKISNYLSKERKVYARHASIVNSSGTGKSRMVDQMAMEIITVPICLREDGSQGFPPPDRDLRKWLCSIELVNADFVANFVAMKLQAFVYSLLTVLQRHLEKIQKGIQLPSGEEDEDAVIERQRILANAFRTNMSEGQTFQSSNTYRKSFYKEVINEADKVIQSSESHVPNLKSPRQSPPDEKAVGEAGEDLCEFIDPLHLLDSNQGLRRPLVVLSFDESDTLADIPKYQGWTVFSELHRTLRGLVDLPIFSLFLSRAVELSPGIRSDPSRQIANLGLKTLEPITEISFDVIALPVTENQVTLDQVVQMDWISHLGRPLFGSYYDSFEDKTKILSLAKRKLLNGLSTLDTADEPGILACLSVRFALQFKTDEISCHVARTQVERHMRVCVAATTEFHRLFTLASSEPLLAEAAYELIQDQAANPVKYLADHSDLKHIHHGRRGELVAALIIMQARDVAIYGARWVSVSQFMQALLPVPAYQELSKSQPRLLREGDDPLAFSKAFEHHSMWFNHVIKIEDSRMINVEILWRFITRGAMIMCKDGQYGVNIVLPVVCDTRKPLSRDNVTAILIQVHNDNYFEFNNASWLFDCMEPYELDLFSEGQPPKPVTRVVFAFASDQDGIIIPTRTGDHSDFTAFDIWCGGLSSNTFKQIGDQDLYPYRRLLQRSRLPSCFEGLLDNMYLDDNAKVKMGLLRRSMAALTTSESNFTSYFM